MDIPDWAQDSPNPPDWAMDSNAPDSGGIRLPAQDGTQVPGNQASPPLTQTASVTSQPDQPKPGLWEGIKRGAQQFDVGSRGLSADLLKSAYGSYDNLPTSMQKASDAIASILPESTKQSLLNATPENTQALDVASKQLNDQGKGTGLAGWGGETMGNPWTYVPLGEVGTGIKGAVNLGTKLGLIGSGSAATAPSENDQGLGDRAANAGESGVLSSMIGPAAHYLGKGVGSIGQWASNKSGFSQLVSDIGTKLKTISPRVFGQPSTGTDLYEMAQKAGLPTEGKSAEQIYTDLQKWHGANVEKAANSVGNGFDPLNGMADISQNYNAERQQSDEFYNQARFHGEGKTVEVNGLQNQLSGAINQLAGKQFRTASEDSALSKLMQKQQDLGWAPPPKTATIQTGTTQPATEAQLAANPQPTTKYQEINKIGYNDLVDMKQALNEGFNPSKFASKGDRPMANLFNNVKDALGRAAEQDKDPVTGASPFGDALYTADRHYSDDLAPTYLNDTLKKFWTPDDHTDYMTSQGWSRRAPNVDTTGRADKMLDNIKTPSDLQAVTQAMSPEQAANLSATWFKKTMFDAGLDGNQIGEHYDTLKYALQGNKPASELLDNIKTGVDAMNARGIGDKARFFDENNPDIMKNAVMGAVALKAGRPLYALNSILNVLDKKQGTAIQKRIKGFAGDINAGAPSTKVLDPAINALANQSGKQTAIGLGQSMNQPDEVPQTIVAPYARGGRVNKYGQVVGILRD